MQEEMSKELKELAEEAKEMLTHRAFRDSPGHKLNNAQIKGAQTEYARLKTRALNLIGRSFGVDDDHYKQLQQLGDYTDYPVCLGIVEAAVYAIDLAEANSTGHRTSNLDALPMHPRIASVCSKLFGDAHYANAVYDASKALVNLVKERSGQHGLDGAPLMRTVFSRNSPLLAFNDLNDQSDMDEQEGMMHLYEGVALGIRNPRGHDFPKDTPERAFEYICLISLLANRVEEAHRTDK